MQLFTADFETLPIAGRPSYPPAPVGLAVHADGMAPRYISWGHATGRNNGTESEAKELLWRVWRDPGVRLLFHNAKFDVAVATERWGFPMLPWDRIDDTTFIAFLLDPHSRSAGLKQLAADLLDMPPEERDAVAEWVQGHAAQLFDAYPQYREHDHKTGREKRSVKKGTEGKWIFAAPAELVEPYAIGDVVRTRALFDYGFPIVQRHGMEAAYDRERQLLPILMENERLGMRVDPQLIPDCELYGRAFAFAEDWLRRELKASGLNFDADADVAETLITRGIVPEENFTLTASGQYSMSKEFLLPELFTGPNGATVASVLGYRNRLKTCLTMFMMPWRDQAHQMNGRITTNWNQIRGYGDGGTRTGRPSTNKHNFLNISKSFEGRDDQYQHPNIRADAFGGSLPALPLVRTYVLPDDGEIFCHRDFSGQELRVFGHFEQGALWGQYQENPALDVHAFVGTELMAVAHREIERTKIKVMNFQAIYGGGVPALQKKLRCSIAEAKELKAFHDRALPGRVILNEEIKRVIMRGDPIRTIGGRLYFEEPRGADGRSRIYKLLNYLVQGSAADFTKQTIIDWYNHPDRVARFLVQVYDEINISARVDVAVQQMILLREVMQAARLGMSVQMLSDGKWGPAWGRVVKFNDNAPDLQELRHAA